MDNVLKQIKDSGRSTDNIVGHLTAGEIVIPKIIVDNKDVKEYLINIFDFHDIDIDEFTVGNKKNKINPKTGYPEFFINKIVKTISNIFKGGGGGDKKKESSGSNNNNSNNQQQADWQKQQADWQAKLEAERKAAEAERKRLADEQAERERQQKIQFENQKAANFRSSSESNLQKDFQSMAENQQRIDKQAAQNAAQTVTAGSGYNIGTAQQQKISAAGGVGTASPAATTGYAGVAGPASTNAPSQTGMLVTTNEGVGGTRQTNNRFTLPTASGLQFGGM